MVFVLIALLLSGIITTSLINNCFINKKIKNNYISNEKASLALNSGIEILKYLEKNKINVSYPLELSFGKDYNIIINMEKISKYENSIKYEITGNYCNNSDIQYILLENKE